MSARLRNAEGEVLGEEEEVDYAVSHSIYGSLDYSGGDLSAVPPLMLTSIDGNLSTSFGANAKSKAPVTMVSQAASAHGVVPCFGNGHFEVVSYNGNKTDDEVLAEAEESTVQQRGSPSVVQLRNRSDRKLSSRQRCKRDNERVTAALADNSSVHCTTQGSNFDLLLRYTLPGRFLLNGVVLRKPPSGWPYPIQSAVLWAYGATDDEPQPDIDLTSEAYNGFTEARSCVQDDMPDGLFAPLPLAYLRIQPDESAIFVPLKKAVLVKYIHVKLLTAYNSQSGTNGAPYMQVGFLGLTGLSVPSGKQASAEGALKFATTLPPHMIYGLRPQRLVISLTAEHYDFMLSHRFVYLFPPTGLQGSRNAASFEELQKMLNAVAKDSEYAPESSLGGDLPFFRGPSPYDTQLTRMCGLWTVDATVAFIDLHNQHFYVMNNINITVDKVRSFLSECLNGTYPRQIKPSELVRIGHLGSGAFGSVFKAVHKPTGEEVAVKVLTKTMPHEVALLQMCRQCPEIVQCRASFRNPSGDSIWVVMEFCGGGTAWELVDNLKFQITEEHVATILKEVLKALVYLEEHGILHRDLKPDNILFTVDGQIKLTDLGCGRLLDRGDTAMSLAGHIVARAPEMGHQPYDHRSDVWSLGKVALVLARLAQLPGAISIQRAEDVNFGSWSPLLSSFVQCCLQPQQNRNTATSLLQHPFITTFARDQTIFEAYCRDVARVKNEQFSQMKPVIALLDELRLRDESTNQIALILDVFASTLRCTGLEHLHLDLRRDLELALNEYTTRILTIGGTREGKSSFINALAEDHLCQVSDLLRGTNECKWVELDLGGSKIKIMDSRGNADFQPFNDLDDMLKSFVVIDNKSPLDLLKQELQDDCPDIILFVSKAQMLDTDQFRNNLIFLRDVLKHIRERHPKRPFPCVIGIMTQVDSLEPYSKPPEEKRDRIETARKIMHERMEECLRPILDKAAQESIEVGSSVTMDLQLTPRLHTFAVNSLMEWSDDRRTIVMDRRWGIDAVRRHLTEDGGVRVTLGLLAACRARDKPRLVAKAWANYYAGFVNRLLFEANTVPVHIWVILAQLIVCTGLMTRTPQPTLTAFFQQLAQLCFVDVPDKPGNLYVYQGMFSWKYRLLSYADLLSRVAEALGEFITQRHMYRTPATFERLVAIIWAQ